MTTSDQRRASLDLANQTRVDRARLHHRVAAGEVAAWKVIEDPPAFVLTTTVFDYLLWVNGIGASRGSIAFRLLRKARVASHTRIGELTENQRARLVEAIRDYANPPHARDFRTSRRAAWRGENAAHPAEKGLT